MTNTVEQMREAREVIEAALSWIDAVPSDVQLPTMPGFDRDWADNVLCALREAAPAPAGLTDEEILKVFSDVGCVTEEDQKFVELDAAQSLRIAKLLLSRSNAPQPGDDVDRSLTPIEKHWFDRGVKHAEGLASIDTHKNAPQPGAFAIALHSDGTMTDLLAAQPDIFTPSPQPEAAQLDFSKPLETVNGEPVKHIAHDVIEYKCARVCVDQDTGVVYSSPYIGLRIRNVAEPTGGEQSFPVADDKGTDWLGMTLRDKFAEAALKGFCANTAIFAYNPMCGWGLVNSSELELCAYAYRIADDMLKARDV